MNTNRVSSPMRNGASMQKATDSLTRELVSSLVQMPGDKPRPKRIKWILDDAAVGRPVRPLGRFPDVAEACLESGASFYHVARPLQVMLAHLRRRCRAKLSADLRAALESAKKECDEAEACALRIAFDVARPSVSELATLERELDEASLATERAKELVSDRRYELEAR